MEGRLDRLMQMVYEMRSAIGAPAPAPPPEGDQVLRDLFDNPPTPASSGRKLGE